MTSRSSLLTLSLLILTSAAPPLAKAEPIVAGATDLYSVATQDITLLANTPFNPGSVDIVIHGLSGYGDIKLNRDAQVGNTIIIPNFTGGMYAGTNPAFPSGTTYVFGNILPLTGNDFSGVINNVVQNTADPGFATGQPSSFKSGDFSFGGNSFGFEFLTGPLAGVKLFTDPAVPFSFAATFDGLPPSPGTVLQNSGPNFLNITFDGQVVATSSNRTITITTVPEPSLPVLLGIGSLSLTFLRYARRRKTSKRTV